jgi:hypothetical protein
VTEASAVVPARVRVAFAHAAVQHLADREGVDVLHIKGIATDDAVRRSEAGGTDADVLVRPVHVGALLAALERHGWHRENSFETGSPFGHAATYRHDHWGYADVHRFFPGLHVDPDAAFAVLWEDRLEKQLGGVTCPVPSLAGQALIQIANLARNTGALPGDPYLDRVLGDGSPLAADVRTLVDRLDARIVVDAVLGRLDRHRDHPDYRLWRVTTQRGTRTEEWLARIRAARTLREKLRLAVRAPLVNTDHLRHTLGHEPTRWEITKEFFDRPRRGLLEEWDTRVRRRRRG